jgi:hypothetical protein
MAVSSQRSAVSKSAAQMDGVAADSPRAIAHAGARENRAWGLQHRGQSPGSMILIFDR